MIKPRGTQQEFIDKSVAILTSESTKKCVNVAPVAYGKSICIANIVMKLDAPTIILQPNKELLEQNYSKYTSYGFKASICSNSLKVKQMKKRPYAKINGEYILCDEVSEVTYATIGTIISKIDEVRRVGVKYLIIDEAHLSTGVDSNIRKFIAAAKIKNVLGVTATAIVLQSGRMGSMLKIMSSSKKNLFSTLSHVVQVQEMVENGYWSKIVYDIKHWSSRGLKFNTSGAKYTKESLKVNYTENNLKSKSIAAVQELKKEGRKSILVFVPTVENAIELSKEIKGSKVVYGDLDTDERTKIIEEFKSLKLQVVINVNILTTGFDHPQLDGIVLSRPTASISVYYQIMGRITRIHPLKPNGRVIDLSGNVTKFGKVEHLNYEYIEGYGWGLFSNDRLLSNHPIQSLEKPTKSSLRKYATSKGVKEVKDHGRFKIWFGKHEGKEIQFIDEGYLTFALENWNFNGVRMKSLKNAIEIYLKLK